MFKHYVTTAWRNLIKYKAFSLINIGGLAIGLAAFWIIALYVGDELSYDRNLPTAARVVRAISYEDWDGGHLKMATSSPPFAQILQAMLPQIEKTVRIDAEGGGEITVGNKHFDLDNAIFTDSTFFEVFPYKFLSGNPATALAGTKSLVLTKSEAEKLFGVAGAAMGKTVLFDKHDPYVVTGVIGNPPPNSHLSFSAIRPLVMSGRDNLEGWQYFNLYTYLLLRRGTDYKQVENRIAGSFTPFLLKKINGGGKVKYRMELQPLTSIHLHSHLDFEMSRNGDIRYVYIFIVAALLILFIAVINYMNLSTARSILRLKEVGVRKAIGSPRGPLVGLFMAESVIITLFAAFLGLLLVELFLPVFNRLSGKELTLLRFGIFSSLGGITLFSLLIGLLSGAYPAFFLSGFGVLRSLKGQLGNQSANLLFRKGLVTFQFVITITMISASCLIYLQLRYVNNADLGFNKEQTLSFHLRDPAIRRQIVSFRNKLLESPLVEGVSGASNPIGNNDIGGRDFHYEKDGERRKGSLMGKILQVDSHFLGTMQIPVIAGRNFSDQVPSDTAQAVIVNETMVKEAGWNDPIGKRIEYYIDDKETHSAMIVGVFKNFNLYSLQHTIEPLALYLPSDATDEDNVFVRINKDHVSEALDYIRQTYKSFDNANAFEYHFLNQNFSRQYEAERKQGDVLLSFTVLAVGLACLGLLGLVNFSATQRTREIGIRKVLGAETFGIVLLLAGDLLKLVLLAGLIAGPLAWWGMYHWLAGFAYHIPLHWWIMLLAALSAAMIALVTMTSQALRAARANPVDALKYE
jgi:putative ABC transport system permease protein